MTIKFAGQHLAWSYYAETHMHDGSKRTISGMFNAVDADHAAVLVEQLLNERLRKPWIWYGVGVTVTPIGAEGVEAFELILEEPGEDEWYEE